VTGDDQVRAQRRAKFGDPGEELLGREAREELFGEVLPQLLLGRWTPAWLATVAEPCDDPP
jgi:hypothetical protein